MRKHIFRLIYLSLIFLFAIHSLPFFVHYAAHRYPFYKEGFAIKRLSRSHPFEYVESGRGTPIVFVHGFQSEKKYFLEYAKAFRSHYKVIAFDLPGHGGTPHHEGQKYDLKSLAKSLASFVEEKKLKKFHLVGASMGGGICAVYAAAHPEKLLSLTLINPLGTKTVEPSDLQKLMSQGKNIFFPKTVEELEESYSYLTGRSLDAGFISQRCLLDLMLKKHVFYQKVFLELIGSEPVDKLLPNIQTPTLLLMGANDRVLHPSSFLVYQKKLPYVKAKLFKRGSHVFTGKTLSKAILEMKEFYRTIL